MAAQDEAAETRHVSLKEDASDVSTRTPSEPEDDSQEDLETAPLLMKKPAPRIEGADASGRRQVEVVGVLLSWMIVSCGMVMFNKWLLTDGGFPYPLLLTAMHMFTSFVLFGAIRSFAPESVHSRIMPSAHVKVPWPLYFKYFFALSVMYATTIGASNLAFLYASVSFLQMMKPLNCLFASVCAFLIGSEVATPSHLIAISIVLGGVMIATHSAAEWSWEGVLFQILSSATEGCRVVVFQSITGVGVLQLDPVTTVYHFSYGSTICLIIASLIMEGKKFDTAHLTSVNSWSMISLSCLVATILNVLIAWCIKKTSGVAFTLCGVAKDIGLIAFSSLIFHTAITRSQAVGYGLAMVGLHLYKTYKDNIEYFKKYGFVEGLKSEMRKHIGRRKP